MGLVKVFKRGILEENPVFIQAIAMCPTLAVTTSAENGLGMGLATMAVLIMANVAISVIGKLIPSQVRIPCYIVLIASFATMTKFLLEGFMPTLYASLGIFIPLIAVNCIIMARAEAFAAKNTPLASLIDGLGMGLGFTLALTIIGVIRELLGAGKIFGLPILPSEFPRTVIMILPPGAFFTLGLLAALIHYIQARRA